MLDKKFCEFLEYKISDLLEHSDDAKIKGFWCDGVLLSEPDKYYSLKFVNDNRETSMTAFIGKDGQTEYEVTLKFGRKALSRYERNLDIQECLPSPGDENCFTIDTEKFKMQIQLL